ncbi:MAG TPA: hypothetical protein VGF01_05010 [Terracidiphilus sp.]
MRCLIRHNSTAWQSGLCGAAFAALALFGAMLGGAQTQAAPTAPTARSHKPAHPHKRVAAATPAQVIPVVPAPTLAAKAAEPEAPAFPIDSTPVPASITWDSLGLRINAANSSLQQILKDVSMVTGTSVEGLDTDQRVFGAYGPGPARDVLTLLLHGSGYNVLMIGDQGQGTPRKILLSSQHPGSTTPGTTTASQENEEETDVEEEQQQQPPPGQVYRPGYPPGTQLRGAQRVPPGQQGPPQPGQPPQPYNPQN